MNTFAPGQRVDWLYKPVGRRQYHKVAWVVEQDGDTVTIRTYGLDGPYFRKVSIETIYSIEERVAA